jgi:hypothetical protein
VKNHHTEKFVVFYNLIRLKGLFVSRKPRNVLNVIDALVAVNALSVLMS